MNKNDNLKLMQEQENIFNSEPELERFAELLQKFEQQLTIPPELDQAVRSAARQKKFHSRLGRRIGWILSSVASIAAAWALLVVVNGSHSMNTQLPTDTPATTSVVADVDELDLLLLQQQIFSEEMKIAIMIDDYLVNPNLN